MGARLRLGPRSEGRRLSLAAFETAKYLPGHHYELVAGRLRVQPWKSPHHDWLSQFLFHPLWDYLRPKWLGPTYVSAKAVIYWERPARPSYLCPDVALYLDLPKVESVSDLTWRDSHPALVAEVICPEDDGGHVMTKARIYRHVPSLREYWIFDGRRHPDGPTLLAFRRRENGWVRREYRRGETYTTNLLPGFSLVIDPTDWPLRRRR